MIINNNGEQQNIDERIVETYIGSQKSWQDYKSGQMLAVIDLLIKQVNSNTKEIAILKAKLIQQEEK